MSVEPFCSGSGNIILSSHFINNVLTMMRTLTTHRRIEELDEAIIHLSKVFHYCQKTDEVVCVQDEINFIEHYLSLQHIRFGERLSFKIDLKKINNEKINKFGIYKIIDYIVENIMEPAPVAGFINIMSCDDIVICYRCGDSENKIVVGTLA